MISTTALQHGIQVHDHHKKILQALDAKDYTNYQFPQAIKDNWSKIKKCLYHSDLLRQYHLYCNCGASMDFPDTTLESYLLYVGVFADDTVAKLIKHHNDTIWTGDKRFVWTLWFGNLADLYAKEKETDLANSLQILFDKLVDF
jgi:hypothetical protein